MKKLLLWTTCAVGVLFLNEGMAATITYSYSTGAINVAETQFTASFSNTSSSGSFQAEAYFAVPLPDTTKYQIDSITATIHGFERVGVEGFAEEPWSFGASVSWALLAVRPYGESGVGAMTPEASCSTLSAIALICESAFSYTVSFQSTNPLAPNYQPNIAGFFGNANPFQLHLITWGSAGGGGVGPAYYQLFGYFVGPFSIDVQMQLQDLLGNNGADLPTSPPASFAALGYSEQTVVPIPAAAWLFGSALGLMGWLRRNVST